MRSVAALRLRARNDSVGVMSLSTMRLSHGLRRRLRADTRGWLSNHTCPHITHTLPADTQQDEYHVWMDVNVSR